LTLKQLLNIYFGLEKESKGDYSMSEQIHGIAWDDRLKLGHKQVDEQHKRLFELVGELVDQCLNGTNVEKLKETLNFLVEYTVSHFYDEESLQVEYNFPEYIDHKRMHEAFKATVGELVQRFEENASSEELSNDVNKIVVRWLIGHIQTEDKKIGRHIRSVIARGRGFSATGTT